MAYVLRTVAVLAAAGLILTIFGCGKRESSKRIVAPAYSVVAHTGSMVPTYAGGELVYIQSADLRDVRPGAIIVYWDEARQLNILHRVIRIKKGANGDIGLLCRGDANSVADLHIVTKDNFVGLVAEPSAIASK